VFDTEQEESKKYPQPLFFKEIEECADRAFANISMLELREM
jgi:hypothetical protein